MNVVCIGSGQLANQLMPALESSGCKIVQIYNRSEETARVLGSKLNSTPFTTLISEVRSDADIYFFTLSDDAIPLVADQLYPIIHKKAIGVHCSGGLTLDALPFSKRAGFYPLQSFSDNHEVSWKYIPIIITTEDENIWDTLDNIASKISTVVYRMTDSQKAILHVAAVFANNFSNHMLVLAERICKENNLPYEILKPLVMETFSKAIISGPSESQTGPAVRGDVQTIEKHLQTLKEYPELLKIYRLITESIKSGSQ